MVDSGNDELVQTLLLSEKCLVSPNNSIPNIQNLYMRALFDSVASFRDMNSAPKYYDFIVFCLLEYHIMGDLQIK